MRGNHRAVVEVQQLRGYGVHGGDIPESQDRSAGMDEYRRNQASIEAGLECLPSRPRGRFQHDQAWRMERYWSPFIKVQSRMLRLLMPVSCPVRLLVLGGPPVPPSAGGAGDPRGSLLVLLLSRFPWPISYGSVRLRSTVEPIRVIFAGYSVGWVLGWWQQGRSPAE